MELAHPLRETQVVTAIEHVASEHLGRRWASQGLTQLDGRASHPSGVLHGEPFSVFAKFSRAADARDQVTAELAGLALLTRLAHIRTPVPVPTYLAIISVDGRGPEGRAAINRLASAISAYR